MSAQQARYEIIPDYLKHEEKKTKLNLFIQCRQKGALENWWRASDDPILYITCFVHMVRFQIFTKNLRASFSKTKLESVF